MYEGRLDVWATGTHQGFASRSSNRKDGKAPPGVAEGLNMKPGDGLNSGAAWGIQVAKFDKVLGHGSALVSSPSGEGRE
jgi:hypothetical protein